MFVVELKNLFAYLNSLPFTEIGGSSIRGQGRVRPELAVHVECKEYDVPTDSAFGS